MRDGVEKSAMGKVQPPVGFSSRELRQASSQSGVESASFLGKLLLNERLQIRPRLGQTEREQANEMTPAFRGRGDQLEDRPEERFENLLDRERVAAGFPSKAIEERDARVVERLHPSIQHREDKRVLGREVIVNRGEVDPCRSGNRSKGGRFEPVRGDEPLGYVQDGEFGGVDCFRPHSCNLIQTFV